MIEKMEMFNRVCDGLCKYSEVNTGKPCELLNSDGCPLSDLLSLNNSEREEFLESYSIRVTMAFVMAVKSIKDSMPLANNEYVRTGYEIALDIIKTSLEENKIDTSFMDEEGDEE